MSKETMVLNIELHDYDETFAVWKITDGDEVRYVEGTTEDTPWGIVKRAEEEFGID